MGLQYKFKFLFVTYPICAHQWHGGNMSYKICNACRKEIPEGGSLCPYCRSDVYDEKEHPHYQKIIKSDADKDWDRIKDWGTLFSIIGSILIALILLGTLFSWGLNEHEKWRLNYWKQHPSGQR